MKNSSGTKKCGSKSGILMFFAAITIPVIIVAGILCQRSTERLCRESRAIIDEVVLSASEGNMAQSAGQCEELEALWESATPRMGVFYDHASATRITESLARLSLYAETGAAEPLRAEAETLKVQIEALEKYDRLSVSNLF